MEDVVVRPADSQGPLGPPSPLAPHDSRETRAILREAPPLVVIDVTGPVTTFSEDAITAAYRQASERGAQDILINFSKSPYVNSAGVSALLGLVVDARRADRRIFVTGLTHRFERMLTNAGLAAYAPVVENEAAALSAAGG